MADILYRLALDTLAHCALVSLSRIMPCACEQPAYRYVCYRFAEAAGCPRHGPRFSPVISSILKKEHRLPSSEKSIALSDRLEKVNSRKLTLRTGEALPEEAEFAILQP